VQQTDPQPAPKDYENSLGISLLRNLVADQKAIWTSPEHLRAADADWLLPLGGATAALFVTDTETEKHLSNSPGRLKYSKDFSNYGLASLVAAGGGMYLWGHMTHDEHKRETGFLAGEAALDSLAVTYATKYSFGRERPLQDNYRGSFWQGGDSFPSEHSSAAWAVASVVAHEYPGPLTNILAYGLATAVSGSRLSAKQHFPSDVLIGSAIGWFVGQEVYRHHHDPELGGGDWETYTESRDDEARRLWGSGGSPYVELDSWIYPAFDRLIALGVIDSGFSGMRPWTRRECARLLGEAEEKIDEESGNRSEAEEIYDALAAEFHDETEQTDPGSSTRAKVESLYSRVTGISGKPLTDGYDFGQTMVNDFGRPYQEGLNSVDGVSGWASSGRWIAYARAEYERAPSAPALPETARQTIASVGGIPAVAPATPFSSVNRVELLDAYVGLNVENWQITFGRQSLWWGPGDGGPMMFGDDAEPIDMFRINRVSPFQLPSFLKLLGPIRTEFFIGQLEGQHFFDTSSGVVGSWTRAPSPQPLIDGWKVSFKLTTNLEVGVSYTTMFGGVGVPTTPGTFVQAILDSGGDLPDGDSKSSREDGLDFSYRIPKLRKWLTFYGDGFAHDQIIFFLDPKERPLPFGYPERAAWHAGIYVPMFPKLRRLDFRAEGVYTNNPLGPRGGYDNGFYYDENRYLNGYTNNGNLLGSWVGRAGQGIQAWTNYWLGARSRLQVNFRHQNVGHDYIPGGGSLTDVGGRVDYWWRSLGLSTSVQHERWLFPVIQPNVSRNVTVAAEVSFEPKKLFGRSPANSAESALRDGKK